MFTPGRATAAAGGTARVGIKFRVRVREFAVAILASFVDGLGVRPMSATVAGTFLVGNIPHALSSVLLSLAPLLRRVILVGEPPLGGRFDSSLLALSRGRGICLQD
jgi:hypothetical protein